MTETLITPDNSNEQDHHAGEALQPTHEQENKAPEQGNLAQNEQAQAEKLNELRQEAKEEAVSTSETLAKQVTQDQAPAPTPLVNKDLKKLKYKRTLASVQKELSPPERALSKVIHNRAVESVSNAAGKTIARPSGVLVGGILALVGTSGYLWVTKHYGYEYNFLMFFVFFAGGFVLGLLLEAIYRIVRLKKRQ